MALHLTCCSYMKDLIFQDSSSWLHEFRCCHSFESMITYWQTRVIAATVSRDEQCRPWGQNIIFVFDMIFLSATTTFLFDLASPHVEAKHVSPYSEPPHENISALLLEFHHPHTTTETFYYKFLQLRRSMHLLKWSQIPWCNFLHTKASHGNLTKALPLVS